MRFPTQVCIRALCIALSVGVGNETVYSKDTAGRAHGLMPLRCTLMHTSYIWPMLSNGTVIGNCGKHITDLIEDYISRDELLHVSRVLKNDHYVVTWCHS